VGGAERDRMRERWHDAIRLLKPGLEVIIPYAERIEIPTSPIRIRRDARRLMDVVWVIAWLHQHGRRRDEAGHILATEEDFHLALRLVSESLTRAWRTLAPAEETVLAVIDKLPDNLKARGFRRRDLKVKGVSDRRVKEVLKSLTDTGYLTATAAPVLKVSLTPLPGKRRRSLWAYPSARRPIAEKVLQTTRILTGGTLSPTTARCPITRRMPTATGKRALPGETAIAR
jgi:hypothetical protein